ncbi:Hsp70 family protein [Phytohabitans rumicis]|uniref:Molecular chaperone DnaK n=1 Tax=Phytohabitans rumicis TaxID=1076125 RepID=A0A6V8KV14_9ACTN|nr:Hsp70 family protein [Phytohabitans rumicis]GFJ86568.1 molecular chaperone DnaK [Phytohabitans rumicis]
MSEESVTYFGIDLGTTYSVISYVDTHGLPTVVRDEMAAAGTTPSAVFFESTDSIVVGASAKNVAKLFPDRVVQRVKREMGGTRQWEFDGKTYTAESISALILKQLAQHAEQETGQAVRQVVITVPAYFGMLERDATRNAGRIAGLDVIGIVPEPVAAALQYEVKSADGDKTVLVYDLGGGTFDTTVIRIAADTIDVLCTDGNQELGGTDWDDRLVKHLVDEFVAKASPTQDPVDDEHFMQELQLTAEDLKRQLSQVESRSVPLRFAGGSAMIEVTRATFEQITQDLLDDTLHYVDRTLEKLAGKLGVADPARHIDEVLLVGGSAKMPAVKARLAEKYGWEPKIHDPDLSVAKGAARFALSRALWDWDSGDSGATPPTAAEQQARVYELAKRTNVRPEALADLAAKQITNVLPKAFGIKLVDTDKPGWQADPDAASYIEHLVHADESLPSGPHVLNAGTVVPNQREVEVKIYEQAGATESRELSANKLVDHDKGIISGLPPLPAGAPIDVAMTINSEGLLTVTATEPVTEKKLTINVRVSVLSEQEVLDAQQLVSGLAVRA